MNNDLISRSALADSFRAYMVDRFDRERCTSEENCDSCDRPCLWIKKTKEAPAVDAVEVVRCKDCKHRESSEFCECRPEDAFCSDGERKEDE